MFKKQPTDNQLIFITFILVALLAIPTFQTLTQKDPVSEMAVEVAAERDRSPASIPAEVPLKVTKAVSHFANYDLNCSGKPSPLSKVAGAYVQFQGKNCVKNFKDGDVEILNKTNGFTASIFSKGVDNYQTDLIQLQEGENEITIRYRQSSGKATEEIIRITASSI